MSMLMTCTGEYDCASRLWNAIKQRNKDDEIIRHKEDQMDTKNHLAYPSMRLLISKMEHNSFIQENPKRTVDKNSGANDENMLFEVYQYNLL